jgi:hypothetical protein
VNRRLCRAVYIVVVMVWTGIEVYYTPGSPHCRAVLMCIRELGLDVDLVKLDMYQKYEHKKPWFIKVKLMIMLYLAGRVRIAIIVSMQM